MDNKNKNSINLNKYISSTGICSRREADKLIQQGKVTINNQLAHLGNRVFRNDKVKINGKLVNPKPKAIYIALNKPVGIVCTTDSKEKNNIVNFVNHKERLFPVGRLDKPSRGLIFLTNDGDIVNKILRAGNNHKKNYTVTVNKPITEDFIKKMGDGIPILGTVTKKCEIEKINTTTFKITLTQGLNRQIRRMCEYLNYKVINLNRTQIMNVKLGGLKVGEWREFTKNEIDTLNNLIKNSSKTQEASIDTNKLRNRFTPKKNRKK